MTVLSDYTLDCEKIHKRALSVMMYLPLQARGEKSKPEHLLNILAYAAARNISITQATNELADCPSAPTVRNEFANQLGDCDQCEKHYNECLSQIIPKFLRKRKRRRLAVDYNEHPYQGTVAPEHQDELVNRKNKKGTNYFFTYATLYMCHQGSRYTLAFTRVKAGDTTDQVLKRLLKYARKLKLTPTLLLLDREFYNTHVMRYLTRVRIRFVIPAKKSGNKKTGEKEATGTHAFESKPEGWYTYVLNKKYRRGRRRALRVWIGVVHRRLPSKDGGWKREVHLYAVWGVTNRSLRWVREVYRKRFGIETTYRQANEGKVKTSTKQPCLRLLFFFVSLLLRQLWVWFHEHVIAKPRRGSREQQPGLMTLTRMLGWIRQEVEKRYGVVQSVKVPKDPEQVWEEFESILESRVIPDKTPRTIERINSSSEVAARE